MLGGRSLNRLGDVVLGAVGCGLARLGVEPLQEIRGVVARVGLHPLEQELFRFLAGEAGDAFELALLIGDELLVLPGGVL